MVNLVEGECLFEREQMFSPVAAGERLRNCLSAGVLQWRMPSTSGSRCGKDRADDPQAGRASDVGDDVVELEISRQRLLHVLDMRGCVLKQTLR